MRIGRRVILSRLVAVAVAGLLPGVAPTLSHALGVEEASGHVETTINELSTLVNSADSSETKAAKLLSIMERRAAMPEIARFAAGTAWRSMNEDQQTRFVAAFGKFISNVYASRFQEYADAVKSEETFKLGGVIDAGQKGMLVKTSIMRSSAEPVDVEWLVTDRPGRVVIADIVIEGVSLLITQREEIGGMLEARGGNVDMVIADLAK